MAVPGWLAVVGLGVGAAVVYGVLHDQATARLSLEYFTVGHPRIVASEDPTVLGLVWGVVATWWVGLALGVLLALSARAGPRPKTSARDLVPPVAVLLAVMGLCAAAAGFAGLEAARQGKVWLLEPLAGRVPKDRHVAYLGVLWTHLASYVVGTVGALVLAARTWRRRGRLAAASATP